MSQKNDRKMEWRELFLWLTAAVLGILICILALSSAPDFEPVGVIYSSAEEGPAQSGNLENGKIPLNRAAKEDLMQIDGIGEKLAERIIQYREEIGGFTDLEQLKNIDGIGEAKFASISDQVILDEWTASTPSS